VGDQKAHLALAGTEIDDHHRFRCVTLESCIESILNVQEELVDLLVLLERTVAERTVSIQQAHHSQQRRSAGFVRREGLSLSIF